MKDAPEVVETELVIVDEDKFEVASQKDFAVAREVIPYEKIMEMSEFFSKGTMIPVTYQRRPENCFIALDLASRMGVSVMVVMQNLYIIQGKPSWSGSAMGALIRSCGYFKNVEIEYVGVEGQSSWGARVVATRISTGRKVVGATVTMDIANKEGWATKTGSKWKTMPELMLGYRAYSWFQRVHAPEIAMGLHSVEEMEDIGVEVKAKVDNPFTKKV